MRPACGGSARRSGRACTGAGRGARACEQAVPHARKKSAIHWKMLSRRLRIKRNSTPVKMVLVCEMSWYVVGSSDCAAGRRAQVREPAAPRVGARSAGGGEHAGAGVAPAG